MRLAPWRLDVEVQTFKIREEFDGPVADKLVSGLIQTNEAFKSIAAEMFFLAWGCLAIACVLPAAVLPAITGFGTFLWVSLTVILTVYLSPGVAWLLVRGLIVRKWAGLVNDSLKQDDEGERRQLFQDLRRFDPRVDVVLEHLNFGARLTAEPWSAPLFPSFRFEWVFDWRLILKWYVFNYPLAILLMIAGGLLRLCEQETVGLVLGFLGLAILVVVVFRPVLGMFNRSVTQGLDLAMWSLELTRTDSTTPADIRAASELWRALRDGRAAGISYWLDEVLTQMLVSNGLFERSRIIDEKLRPFLVRWFGGELPQVAEVVLERWSKHPD